MEQQWCSSKWNCSRVGRRSAPQQRRWRLCCAMGRQQTLVWFQMYIQVWLWMHGRERLVEIGIILYLGLTKLFLQFDQKQLLPAPLLLNHLPQLRTLTITAPVQETTRVGLMSTITATWSIKVDKETLPKLKTSVQVSIWEAAWHSFPTPRWTMPSPRNWKKTTTRELFSTCKVWIQYFCVRASIESTILIFR